MGKSIDEMSPEEGIPLEFVYRVGWVAVSWAMVEYGLDSAAREVFAHHGGTSIQSSAPASLKAKIQFLRKAFNQLPSLAGCAAHGHALLDEVNDLKHQRNDVMHGIVAGPGDEGHRLMRFRYEESGHVSEIYAYALEDLATLSGLMANLAARLSFLPDLIVDDQCKEALRELSVGKPAVVVPQRKLVFEVR